MSNIDKNIFSSADGIKVKPTIVKNNLPILKKPSIFIKPEIFFQPLIDLNKFTSDESNFVKAKLNEQLQTDVLNSIGPVSEAMANVLQTAVSHLDYETLDNNKLSIVIKDLLDDVAKKNIELKDEATNIGNSLTNASQSKTVRELLQLDVPLKNNPIFRTEINKAKIMEYSKIAKIGDAAAKKMVDANLNLEDLHTTIISDLIKQDILNENQVQDLYLVVSLGKLTDDNLAFIKTIQSNNIKSIADLANWEKSDWKKFITDGKVPVPPEETIDTYTENIFFNIERTYPSQALIGRITNPLRFSAKLNSVSTTSHLLSNNNKLIEEGSLATIDLEGTSAANREEMKNNLQDLVYLSNTYRHLNIDEIINDKNLDPKQKENAISNKIKLLDTFYKNNSDPDLRLVNFFDKDEKLVWSDIPVDDQAPVRKQLMAYQRLLTIAEDTDVLMTLLENGYDSAMSIAGKTEEEFVRTSGLELGKARMTYAKAQECSVSVAHNFEAIRDAVRGQFKDIRMSNINTALGNDLKKIDGFANFFGSQNFCACEECRSILSPAAYFVDLMHFVDKYISQNTFSGADDSNSLYLKNRRPDLWSLNLTCENTDTLVPYLTIVNEVLQAYLKEVLPDNNDVFGTLNKENISFSLPFNMPLEELRIYLSHFGISLHELYRTVKQPEEKIWRARINISTKESQVITTSDASHVTLRFGNPYSLQNFAVQDFIHYTGITREQLTDLLAIKFNPDLQNIVVNRQADPHGDELLNFIEVLTNLEKERLDFIHRFIRLWKKTSWSIPELDLILTALKDSALISTDFNAVDDPDETNNAVIYLAKLIDIQEKLNLTVEELFFIINHFPEVNSFPAPPPREADKRLFERIFGKKELYDTNLSVTYNDTHPPIDVKDSTTSILPVLLGGMGVSESEFFLLFDLLRNKMQFNVADSSYTLDRKGILLLYRHVRIAKALKFGIEDFIQALHLNFDSANPVVMELDQIHQLMEFTDWIKTSPFTVPELWFILKGEESNVMKYKVNSESISAMVLEIQQSQEVNKGTVAKLVLEIQQSQEVNKVEVLKASLSKSFNLSSDQLIDILEQVNMDVNSVDIQTALNTTFTNGTPDKPADLDALLGMERVLLLFRNLSKSFNLSSDQLIDILKWVPVNAVDIQTALNTTFTNGTPDKPADLDALLNLTKQMERILLILSNLKFGVETLSYITKKPETLGIVDLRHLTLNDLNALVAYKKLIAADEDAEPSVQAILDGYTTNPLSINAQAVADLWKQDKSLIDSLIETLSFSSVPIQAIGYLQDCANMCQTLGITGPSLQKLVKDSQFDELTLARDIALGAFSSKYTDEQVRNEKLEPYQDKINVIKRDALCDYIIARLQDLKFKGLDEIYSFFLLDVEMNGCARTSRLVCAISSLQLYVHRCLVNLEQSTDVKVDPSKIPAKEWEWMKNYRVWQANRKVFLYPENYIELDLRDDKTPIFKELEDELLQQKITKESAEAAYKKYVSQFAELARLRIAGAYYHEDSNTYYLFGRTSQDPPQYYYRKWDDSKVWKPWEKIDLTINSDRVSAVIHQGKMYLFWMTVKSVSDQSFSGGSSSTSWTITKDLVYSFLNEQGKWNTPQSLPFQKVTNATFDISKLMNKVVFPLSITKELSVWHHEPGFNFYNSNYEYKGPYSPLISNDSWYIGNTNPSKGVIGYTIDLFTNSLHQINDYDLKNYSLSLPNSDLLIFRFPSFGQPPDYPHADYPVGPYYLSAKTLDTLKSNIIDGDVSAHKNHDTRTPLHDRSSLLLTEAELDNTLGLQAESPEYYQATENFGRIDEIPEFHLVGYKFGEDFLLKVTNQQYLIQKVSPYFTSSKRTTLLLSTSLSDKLGEILFSNPLEMFLSLETQKNVEDTTSIFKYESELLGPSNNLDHIDFHGAYGVYYQELFFHIPFLIANHLNANQKYEEAKWWYERIFDPTANDSGGPVASAAGTSELSNIVITTKIEKQYYAIGDTVHVTGQVSPVNSQVTIYILDKNDLPIHESTIPANEDGSYESIFDTNSSQVGVYGIIARATSISDGSNFNLSPEIKFEIVFPTDHNWRYIEFRELTIQKMQAILTDPAAIKQYKDDPFNPYAIARLRMSAYQKTIVMKYIDNLLDWGDYLFAQDTTESINEATMLYVLASDILGKRPAKLGKCETTPDENLTYGTIEPTIKDESDFLITLESWSNTNIVRSTFDRYKTMQAQHSGSITFMTKNAGKTMSAPSAPQSFASTSLAYVLTYDSIRHYREAVKQKESYLDSLNGWEKEEPSKVYPASNVVKSALVFCIPSNDDLLKYWDTVEDRLFKIRNCMNISGVRRQLALFSPPIDPMMLVRARAAGLSLEDILATLSDFPPPYRFSYLIEKAKQFTQTVQSFGSALLSALEKKDVEELTLLRSVHERNILQLTKEIKKQQVKEAQSQLQAMVETKTNVQNRIDYYNGLIQEGLTGWETTQQISRHISTGLKLAESVVHLSAALTFLLPQVGSPFAMKYGGKELGDSGVEFAQWTSSMAAIADAVSASAGLEASFQRREQEWKQQLQLAQQELKQVEQQRLAAEIRQQISENDLEIHEKNMEQADELDEFYKNKFTNLGLYNYLATSLNRLYREAYSIAYDMAKKAERAYKFERDDDIIFVAGDNWQSDKAGLLAGERLLLQLQHMEKAYIEQNKRNYEVTQSFSLALLDPSALVELRQGGSTDFKIPEIMFDLFYPGQYKRLIKSVRVTIPCVAGPYTNVSAKLTLTSSKVRNEAKSDDNGTSHLTYQGTTSIATSNAQNDGGMFELNFRDERYLPFEGAGAVSDWNLELPSKMRSFDYGTISDVIIHINYTAKDDGSFKDTVENDIKDKLQTYASNNGLFRLFSMKHEFPDSFYQLLHPISGVQSTQINITQNHFPYFLNDSQLSCASATIYLKPKDKVSTLNQSTILQLNPPTLLQPNNSTSSDNWANFGTPPTMLQKDVSFSDSDPVNTWTINAGANGLDDQTLDDILILLKYTIKS